MALYWLALLLQGVFRWAQRGPPTLRAFFFAMAIFFYTKKKRANSPLQRRVKAHGRDGRKEAKSQVDAIRGATDVIVGEIQDMVRRSERNMCCGAKLGLAFFVFSSTSSLFFGPSAAAPVGVTPASRGAHSRVHRRRRGENRTQRR